MLIFADDKRFLRDARKSLLGELARERLRPHATKCRIHTCAEGVSFLGFRYRPDAVRVLSSNRRRFERRIHAWRTKSSGGADLDDQIEKSAFGWMY